ncbi:MAG: hypothetical protein A2498_16820 [Lentisphaerae bacterium RIFOXYC12_FULL_60_16]|nr:MAG: hypothetical protein A2498_16820 [Lentisphaerae bacterium RIFOXYC12_FULL_60_16]
MAKAIKKTRFCQLTEKQVAGHLEEFLEQVTRPRYICRRCLRVSHDKRNLCKPEKLKTFARD